MWRCHIRARRRGETCGVPWDPASRVHPDASIVPFKRCHEYPGCPQISRIGACAIPTLSSNATGLFS
jgi:hypothetical protein